MMLSASGKDGFDESKAEERRHARLHQKLLLSNLGQVMDVSAGGLRIRSRRRPPPVNHQVEITLSGMDMPARVLGRVVWTRRTGLFSHEMGIELVNPDPTIVQFFGMIACSDIRHMPYPGASTQ